MRHLVSLITVLVLAIAAPALSAVPSVSGHTRSAPDNADMKAIYDADQSARAGDNVDWKLVAPQDVKRREQTNALLAAGALHTGRDYRYAAFIYQHGDLPDDYLLAHTLAMVAMSKGDHDAVWIATATLDRYLQTVKQKQIYGTQFSMSYKPPSPTTQEPYDRRLIPDALRVELHVPTLAAQERQRAEMEGQRAAMMAHIKGRVAKGAAK
jgi:hypothetical protein